MKEASESIKEKGIKTSHLKELSEMGMKLPINQPYFPIQVNVVCPTKGNEKVLPTTEILYVNDFAYDSKPKEHYIRMNLMKNSHKIKSFCENLSAKVEAIKGLVKHCEIMNNQVEQIISLQNQLYENLIGKKQVCGVKTRGGASTQDPDFPNDHPKRREQDALEKKSFAGQSPNENEDNGNSEEQDKDTSISGAGTEDNNNENDDEELFPPDKEQQEAAKNEESVSPTREDPQPSIEKNNKKKHPSPQKGKDRIHGSIDPYPIPKR
jgi:hypothetical protein